MLLLSMLLIHLVLQLWLISVNLTICTLAYANEHSIIHNPEVRRRVPHCVPVKRAYARSTARICAKHHAQRRDTVRVWRAAPERDSRACQPSPLIRPGQNRSDGSPSQARPGAVWGAGRWALILSWGAGRWVLVRAPQRPCQPWRQETQGRQGRQGTQGTQGTQGRQ